jgi:hypothetical protein
MRCVRQEAGSSVMVTYSTRLPRAPQADRLTARAVVMLAEEMVALHDDGPAAEEKRR